MNGTGQQVDNKRVVYTHCILCGRKLKNPVSQLSGVGTKCCKKTTKKSKLSLEV